MLTDTRFNLLRKAMNYSALRQKVIADNIANVSTPGYKRKDVDFLNLVREAEEDDFVGLRTNPRHLVIGKQEVQNLPIRVVTEDKTSLRNDENNVDLDQETTYLIENNLYFNTLTSLYNIETRKLREVLRGRI